MKRKRNPISKRLFDWIVTLIGMVIALPVMGIVALLVRLKLGKPVLFEQERPGLGGEIFTLRKFRSMRDAADKDGNPLPDEDCILSYKT